MNSSESSSLTGSSNAVISHKVASEDSLSEVHRSIYVPSNAPFWRKMLAFFGPGFMVAVGYMDPGNWATDLAAGAQFGYTLLSVIMISNLMAILFQHLCVKLGIATNRDLAQACRDNYSRPTVWFLWILCEIQVAACDLAEVVGSAIALLASGQNSTLTGTPAGQIIMEGFINIRLQPWLRRVITRALAVVPTVSETSFMVAQSAVCGIKP